MQTLAKKRLQSLERILCVLLIGWLQLVGVLTHSILHHVLHAAPLALLLFVKPSPARHFTGFLAGFLWVFMLGIVTAMLHDALILDYIVTHSHIPYTWLAPGAATLAAAWAATNAVLTAERPRWFLPALLAGLGMIPLFAWAHPYVSQAFLYPLERTLAGEYVWVTALLAETAMVLAMPSLLAFRVSPGLKWSASFVGWQIAYWVFFVVAMVAGLLPAVNR